MTKRGFQEESEVNIVRKLLQIIVAALVATLPATAALAQDGPPMNHYCLNGRAFESNDFVGRYVLDDDGNQIPCRDDGGGVIVVYVEEWSGYGYSSPAWRRFDRGIGWRVNPARHAYRAGPQAGRRIAHRGDRAGQRHGDNDWRRDTGTFVSPPPRNPAHVGTGQNVGSQRHGKWRGDSHGPNVGGRGDGPDDRGNNHDRGDREFFTADRHIARNRGNDSRDIERRRFHNDTSSGERHDSSSRGRRSLPSDGHRNRPQHRRNSH